MSGIDDFSNFIQNDGNKLNLSGNDLSEENYEELLKTIIEKNPNITELDITNCNLTTFPKILLNLKKISIMDIRNNNFEDFESLINDLLNFKELSDLKIDLKDQNEVLLILDKIQSLILLNGKSTKDATSIIDIEEKDIEDISLQHDLPLYTEIIKKLNSNNAYQNLVNDFQAKLYEEAEKVKNCLNNNAPNYIYANIVIQGQFKLQKYLSDKFIERLEDKNQEIGKLLFKNIFKSGELLIKLINNLYPKIEEKTDNLRNQLEEAWKAADEINDYEKKYKLIYKEKQLLENNYSLLKSKIEKIENENKMMTQQLLKNAKDIYTRNKENDYIKISNQNPNPVSKNQSFNLNKREITKPINLTNSNNFQNKSNSSYFNNNNNQNQSLNPIPESQNISHPKILTIKMTKEIINEIYNSKAAYDKKCYDNKLPRETMEQHMYTYLNQKYGLKNLIIEWASSIINAIKIYSSKDNEINLFGKILRNEQEEDSRLILTRLKTTISELLEYYLKTKNPLKNQGEIKKMLENIKEGSLNEEEWKGIIYYIYTQIDAENLENKITNFIYLKNNESMNYNNFEQNISNTSLGNNIIHSSSKSKNGRLTREEIFNLNKVKDELSIPYKDFLKLVGEHQIRSREIYLNNFVILFRKFDSDGDGILNEDEFIGLIKSIPFLQNNIDDYIFKFLSIIDPFNNKRITFSECVSLFSMEIMNDENNNNYQNQEPISLLDRICLSD